jgi:hypothetical protein
MTTTMNQLLVLALAVVLAIGVTAVAAGRAAARGRRPWLPLAAVWVAVALPPYAIHPEFTARSLVSVVLPLVPLGVTALASEMEVRRGCSLRRAGSVAVGLGVVVAVVTPFLVLSFSRLLCAATDCL